MPTPKTSPELSELRSWLQNTVRFGSRAERARLLEGVTAWARKEEDPEVFQEIFRLLARHERSVAGTSLSLQDLLASALQHARRSAISSGHLQQLIRERPELVCRLTTNPRLSASHRGTILGSAMGRAWGEIQRQDYRELPQSISMVVHVARRREDRTTSWFRDQLADYARSGKRPGQAQPFPDTWMQRMVAGLLFSFPKLPVGLQEELFEVIVSGGAEAKTQSFFLHEAAKNPDTEPSLLLRILKFRGRDRADLLRSLNSNPTARALPEFEKTILAVGHPELLRERLGRARGEEFRRYFRRLAEVAPAKAIAALELRGAQKLEARDLLPLALSSDPEIRLAAIRHQGQVKETRTAPSPQRGRGR